MSPTQQPSASFVEMKCDLSLLPDSQASLTLLHQAFPATMNSVPLEPLA